MFADKKKSPWTRILIVVLLGSILVSGYLAFRWYTRQAKRLPLVMSWIRDPLAHPEWMVKAGELCGDAPFLMPTDGLIGFLWGDSFRPGHRHQGWDIFGLQELNQTPVLAAYSGFLTRLPDWKSSLIIRIPEDPLHPGRQIWTYYTHMADKDGASYIQPQFQPGTHEMYVEAGTLLGYQGNYSGDPDNPTGIHLHFSIVLDDDQGRFRNELEIENTLDPSPYLGVPIDADQDEVVIPLCPEEVSSTE